MKLGPYTNFSDDALISLANTHPSKAIALELALRYERLRDCVRQAIDRLENNPPPKQGNRHEF